MRKRWVFGLAALLHTGPALAEPPADGSEGAAPPAPATTDVPTSAPDGAPPVPDGPPPPLANPSPPASSPSPTPNVAPAPDPAELEPAPEYQDRHAHRHDGFYLRMGAGVGYGHVTTRGTVSGVDVEATYTGPGPAFELLIGGTPLSGFVLGGGFVGQDISRASITIKTSDPNVSVPSLTATKALGVGAMGLFADWFPDPAGGAHFGGMVGISLIGLKDDSGFGGSLWGGYDFWIGKQWSLGLEARAAVASGSRTFDSSNGFFVEHTDWKDTGETYELVATALYH